MKFIFLFVFFSVVIMEQSPKITFLPKSDNLSHVLIRVGGNAPNTDELKSLICIPKRNDDGNIRWNCNCWIPCNWRLELVNIVCETHDFSSEDICKAEYNINYERSCVGFVVARNVTVIQNKNGSFSHRHDDISFKSFWIAFFLICMLLCLCFPNDVARAIML